MNGSTDCPEPFAVVRVGAALCAVLGLALAPIACSSPPAAVTCGRGKQCPAGDASYCDPIHLTCTAPPHPGACNELSRCTDPDAPICDVDTCIGCYGDDDCRDERPICLPEPRRCGSCTEASDPDGLCAARDDATPRCGSSGVCVECLGSSDCGGDTPICASASKCVACLKHVDCDSGYCETSGRCGDAEALIFVDGASGSDGAGCGTAASPCRTIGGGVAQVGEGRRRVLVQPGTYREPAAGPAEATVTLADVDVVIEGLGDVTWTPAISANGVGIAITGAAEVELDLLTIEPDVDSGSASVVGCTGAGDAHPVLHLRDVKILRGSGDGLILDRCTLDSLGGAVSYHGGTGIVATESTLHVERNLLSGNNGPGVRAVDSAIEIERNKIRDNRGGGVDLTGCAFALRNNYIVTNGLSGETGSDLGGVRVTGGGGPERRIELNTIADNFASADAQARGVNVEPAASICASNIVRGGSGGAGDAIVAGSCTWSYSNVEGGVTGQENIDLPPSFANEVDGDYALASGSAGIDAADPTSTVDIDFDGEPRPQGAGPDIGADEVE